MEIVPGLYRVLGNRLDGVNAYLWLSPSDDGSVLFDCGWPWSGKALATGLRRVRCAPEDLRVIAITHDDVDHSGRLAQLTSVSAAPVFAHSREIPRFERNSWRAVPGRAGPVDVIGIAAWAIYGRYPHVPIHGVQPLAEGDELPGGWVTLHTPGHTPGHASYYQPKYRVLIAGDSVGPAPAGQLRAPQAAYCEDGNLARKSIEKLAALDPEIICCGHGPIILDGGAALQLLASTLHAP
jgi:glyoxylase-like metal-dependent hydrolase (beta-lactamase superfamily II)